MRILITGATGTLGNELIKNLEDHQIICLSRNETLQLQTKNKFSDIDLEFISGDIADPFIVEKAIKGCEMVYHLAANKHVEKAEVNPHTTIQTNVIGTQNIINSSIRNNVKQVIGISSDKACAPINLYGMSKRMLEKLFIEADLQTKDTDFYVVRYGNVLHSAGSVTTKWKDISQRNISKVDKEAIKITNPTMRRFYFSVYDAVRLIQFTLDNQLHGKIVMKMMKYLMLKQLADQFCEVFHCQQEIIDVRPGEKQAEQLIADYEVPFTYQSLNDDYMMIDEQCCALPGWHKRHSEYNTMNCDYLNDQEVSNMIRLACV